MEFIRLKEFEKAANLLDQLIDQGAKDAFLLRLAVGVHLKARNYDRSAEIIQFIGKSYSLNADDYANEGYLFNMLHEPDKAMDKYKVALYLNPKHIYALNNTGYCLILLNQPKEAMPYFEKVIKMSPSFAYSYCSRGWAYIIFGELEKGLADLNHALSLDDSIADIYRNLGLYYMEKGDLALAKEQLEKAKGIENEMPMLEEYLARLERLQDPITH